MLNTSRGWGGFWKQLSGSLLVIVMTSATAWAADVAQFVSVQPNPQTKQITLTLSKKVHASLSMPVDKGVRYILIDISSATLEGANETAVRPMLRSLSEQLSEVRHTTLNEFSGSTPLVRLMIKTKASDVVGKIIKNDGTTLVVQLIHDPTAALSLAKTNPPAATPAVDSSGAASTPSASPSVASSPSGYHPIIIGSAPPASMVIGSQLPTYVTPPEDSDIPPITTSPTTPPVDTIPTPSPAPAPSYTSPAPSSTGILPPVENFNSATSQPVTYPEIPPLPEASLPVPTPTPISTPAPIYTPPPAPTPAIVPQALPDIPETNAPLQPESDQPPLKTLSTGTAISVSQQLEREQFRAETLHKDRDRLASQVKNMQIRMNDQDRVIAELKAEQHRPAVSEAAGKKAKDDLIAAQQEIVSLQKSYNDMRQSLITSQNDVKSLSAELQRSHQQIQADSSQMQQNQHITFPADADQRAELLSTLDTLTQAQMSTLLDGERAYRAGRKAEATGKLADAETAYRQAITYSPKVAEYAAALGELFITQHRYADARPVLTAALKYHPTDPTLLNDLGKAALFDHDDTAATEYFRRALPVAVLSNYAISLRRLNQYDEAEALYKLAIAANPSDSDLQYNLGNLYLAQKRYSDAQSRFSEALRLNPKFAEAEFHLGLAYNQQGKLAEAKQAFVTYLQMMPTAPNRAEVQDYLKDLTKAIKPNSFTEQAY